MTLTIASHEFKALLRSAQTWVLAALISIVFAYQFLQALETFLDIQPKLALQDHPLGLTGFLSTQYLAPLAFLLALICPLLAMRSFSDEFRQQTMPLWQSSPISTTSLVLGKFLGVLGICILIVAIACVMVLSMQLFVTIDLGVLAAAFAGMVLCAASFVAIGLFFSSLTKQAIIAAVASIMLILLLWLIGSAAEANPSLQALVSLAIPTHVAGFFQGFIASADIAYFALLIILFLGLCIIRLDALRNVS